MGQMLLLTLVLVFAALVSSRPLASSNARSFSSPATYHPVVSRKYNQLTTRDGKRRATSSTADIPYHTKGRYTTPFTLGPDGQQLDLVPDSGSADFWVYSSLAPKDQYALHNPYNLDAKDEIQGCTFDISFLDRSGAIGNCTKNTVTAVKSDPKDPDVTTDHQLIEVADNITDPFSAIPPGISGFVGLAWANKDTYTVKNTVDDDVYVNFLDNAKIDQFGVYFPYQIDPPPSNQPDGSVDWGLPVKSERFTGDLTKVGLEDVGSGLWKVKATQCSWHGSPPGTVTTYAAKTAIMDTGTALIRVDAAIVDAYWKTGDIGSSFRESDKMWTYDCSKQNNLAPLQVEVDGKMLPIPKTVMRFYQDVENGGACVGSFQRTGDVGPIYGVAFFNAYYGFFNRADKTFNYGPIKPMPTP